MISQPFRIACVKDHDEVFASIDKEEWEEKVLQDDYNRLREEVAADIKKGNKAQAMDRIDHYYHEQQTVNSVVGSGKVARSLEKDLDALRGVVKETFAGAPAEVAHKQKKNAKVLQYEGYSGRRTTE
jgi:Ca-activated chloride channel family protein